MKTHTGYQPGLCRGPTPPGRGVVPLASFKSKVGKTWVSLWRIWRTRSFGRWMQVHNLLQKSEFSSQEFKTWTWVPILEGHARTNTNPGFRFQLLDQNETFLQNTWTLSFSFRNQLQIDAWHAKQTRSWNAARWSISTIKVDQGSYLKTRTQRIKPRRSSLEDLLSLKNFSSFSLELLSLMEKNWHKEMICC